MQEEEYTFVTLDGADSMFGDAVVVDVDSENDLSGIVMVDDEGVDVSDFITLSDDTVVLSDMDIQDAFSADIDGADVSFMV